MRIFTLLLTSLVITSCSNNLTTPTEEMITTARLTDSSIKASNIKSVTCSVYSSRSAGACRIDGYICGAVVTVTSNGLVASAVTINPQGKATVPVSRAITQTKLSYQGNDCTFTTTYYSNEVLLTVIKCG